MQTPIVLDLPAGEHYVCLCGQSNNLPYCDGSHQGSEYQPRHVIMQTFGTCAVCSCLKSGNAPFCDGSHRQ
ncbi:MAG: CDGSH iron-sulfur domain-containing protein [Magnetococcus sp. YQC-5]